MLQRCGWLSGRHYCNLPATGIGGPLAYMGPRQRLKRSLSHDRRTQWSSSDSTGPGNRLIKQFDLFRGLCLVAGVADIKSLRPRFAFPEPNSIARVEEPGLPCTFASTCDADQAPPTCRSP